MALLCKYCGREVKNNGGGLSASVGGTSCSSSPSRKHVAVANPPYCVYCGRETKPQGSSLFASIGGTSCQYSPTKKHQLAD